MRSRSKRRGGGVAQLGERLLCKQEVIGSIPFTSTSLQSSGPQALAPRLTANRESFSLTS